MKIKKYKVNTDSACGICNKKAEYEIDGEFFCKFHAEKIVKVIKCL